MQQPYHAEEKGSAEACHASCTPSVTKHNCLPQNSVPVRVSTPEVFRGVVETVDVFCAAEAPDPHRHIDQRHNISRFRPEALLVFGVDGRSCRCAGERENGCGGIRSQEEEEEEEGRQVGVSRLDRHL